MVVVTVRKQTSQLSGSRKKLAACVALWMSVLSVAGCDASSSGPPISTGGNVRTEKLKTNLSADEAREFAQPITTTPGLSVETGAAQNTAIGNEVFDTQMNPAKGLNTKRLFDTKAENDDARFERLEAAVQAMRDDFDRVNPSINRLMAIEGEIQTLVDQLQVLTGGAPADAADVPIPPVSAELLEDQTTPTTMPPLPADAVAAQNAQPAPVQAAEASPVPITPPPAAPAPAAAAPAPVASGDGLVALRVGDHDKSTRIVFETTEKLNYTADIDSEKILVVNFTSGISQMDAAPAPKSDLVKSVDITPQASGGFIAAMSLSKMTKIVRQGVLTPDAQNPNYRIYIDLER